MKEYYVVEKGDMDWDLDNTECYRSREEAKHYKKKKEELTGKIYQIWEVD